MESRSGQILTSSSIHKGLVGFIAGIIGKEKFYPLFGSLDTYIGSVHDTATMLAVLAFYIKCADTILVPSRLYMENSVLRVPLTVCILMMV